MGPPFDAPAHHGGLLASQRCDHPPPMLPGLFAGEHQEGAVARGAKLSTLSPSQKSGFVRLCFHHAGSPLLFILRGTFLMTSH